MPTNHRLVFFIPQGTVMQENNKIMVFSPVIKKKKLKFTFLNPTIILGIANNLIILNQKVFGDIAKNKTSESTFNLRFKSFVIVFFTF